MNPNGIMSKTLMSLACIGLVFPQLAMAARSGPVNSAKRPTAAVRDIALGAGGKLSGRVIDTQGRPLANRLVSVRQGRRVIANAITDTRGRFTIRGLRGGTFLLATPGAMTIIRAWSAETAPPPATAEVTLVVLQRIVRGQDAEVTGTWGEFLTNFWVLSGIATAIVLPIALADDDKPLASP